MTQFSRQLNWRIPILLGLLVIITTASLLVVQPAFGQAEEATYELDLAALGYSTKVLMGPTDSIHYYFSLPANWVPRPGTYLQLNLDYTVSGKTGAAPSLLAVNLNGESLHTEELITSTVTSVRIEIPPETLRLAENARVNNLELGLQVSGRCEEAHETTRLSIQSSSRLGFVYRERPLPLDLVLYPKPLYYRGAFETTPARMILPPQPNASELGSAAMIAANLGGLTGHNLPLEAHLDDSLPITNTEQHLVMIGSPERMPLLSQLDMPLPLRQRRMSLRSQMPAAVSLARPFSYTLMVENTSTAAQSLTVIDRLAPLVSVATCQGCSEVTPGLLRWEVGSLAAGEIISTVVQARLDPALSIGDSIEHTASLLDADGQVVNVDTLTTTIALEPSDTMVSSPDKGPYFFSMDDQGVPETDGVVQLLVSPWSGQRAVVAVTGLNDPAVLLAAHALAAQSSMPGMRGQFALVQATRPITVDLASQAQDVTLAQLGNGNIVNVGANRNANLRFNMPRGAVLAEEAYLVLHLAHGTALNAISATLELSLNNLPFHSIELRAENADDAWSQILLPGKLIKPGINELSVRTVANWPSCPSGGELARLWVTIYGDSFFHLSYDLQEAGPTFDLADYPQFLSTQPGLQDVILLVAERVTPDEVQGMVQLLSFLGDAVGGEYFTPRVIPGGQATPDQWQGHHLVVLGRPTRNPYIGLVNDELPQPFIAGSDEIRQQVDNVIYRLPPGYDLGYIQLLPVPWDEARAMLVVTGTTDAGLGWALRALSAREASRQMKGNLAVMVRTDEIHTTDTRQPTPGSQAVIPPLATSILIAEATVTLTPTPTQVIAPTPTPPAVTPTAANTLPNGAGTLPNYRPPIWTTGLLAISILIIVGTLGVAIWRRRPK